MLLLLIVFIFSNFVEDNRSSDNVQSALRKFIGLSFNVSGNYLLEIQAKE